jgi:hypothetical protein
VVAGERIDSGDAEIRAKDGEVARARARAEDLERIAARLAERVAERDRELRMLRDDLRAGGDAADVLTALAEEIDSLRRQARGQATRIRLAALRQAADVSERLAEVPGGQGDGVVKALAAALERVGAEAEDEEPAPRLRRARDEFDGFVEIEIGPLADFSKLVGFEDAARSIAATSELSIRRFSEGRATLTMTLKEPVELIRELEERCELHLSVRERGADRLVLDVAAAGPAAEAA